MTDNFVDVDAMTKLQNAGCKCRYDYSGTGWLRSPQPDCPLIHRLRDKGEIITTDDLNKMRAAGCDCQFKFDGESWHRTAGLSCKVYHGLKNKSAYEKAHDKTEEPIRKRKGHPDFYELTKKLEDLHARKNNNYSIDYDPLSNLRRCENIGIPAPAGVLVRLQDKWCRIEELMKGKLDLVNESLEDTLLDNACYSLLMIILLREKKCRTTSQASETAAPGLQ